MSPHHMSIPNLIDAGTVAVTNLETEADLQALLQPYGYDAPGIADGRALLDDLAATASGKTAEYGQQYASTDDLDAAREAFHGDVYMPHVAIARVVFRDQPAVQARLARNGGRERGFAAWHEQAQTFYTNLAADPALVAATTVRNLTQPMIQSAVNTLRGLAQMNAAQENRKGMAQGSTDERDIAAQAFADWYTDLRDLARVALSGSPEWIERLGFLHRNEGDPN